jgi:hypothetical protein
LGVVKNRQGFTEEPEAFLDLSIAALLALRSRRSLRLCYIAGRRLPSHSDNLKTDGQLAYQSPLADGKNDA